MSKIKFYLTNPTAKKETPLYCLINYGLFRMENGKKKYLPLKYYPDIFVLPKLWNKNKNRAIETNEWADVEAYNHSKHAVELSANKNYTAFNNKIINFEVKTNTLINTLMEFGELPQHDILYNELDRIFKPSKIAMNSGMDIAPQELFPFIDYFIKTTNYKTSTVKSYKVVRQNLWDYHKTKKRLTFANIDIDFYNSFIEYLTVAKKLSANTVGTRIKILKTFLNEAHDRGIKICEDYKKKSFRKPREETFSIYLTETELERIYNLTILPHKLEKVRDLFLIGCYTGLRFSDFTQLTKDNLTAENTIRIRAQKTNDIVVIPIHTYVKQIFEKYNYQLPRIPSNQKFNEYIKEVAETAKINDGITKETMQGNFKMSTTTEKYNLVTSHTARRSFATNAFINDIPTISIMKITGHKTETAFMKYIKISAEDNARKMQGHRFFNKLQIAK